MEDEFTGLRVCPICGDFFDFHYCEDNDPTCHSICLRCDVTWSWDDEGYWQWDRTCTCGKPAILNVSNGLVGCLDPSCPDYMTDGLEELDYVISGYKLERRIGYELDDA